MLIRALGLLLISATIVIAQDGPIGVPVQIKAGAISLYSNGEPGDLSLEMNVLPSMDIPDGLFNLSNGAGVGAFSVKPTGATANDPKREKYYARMEPGKNYAVTITGDLVKQDSVYLMVHPPSGYEVEINGDRRTSYTTTTASPFNYSTGLILNVRVFNPAQELSGRAGTASSISSGRVFWQVALGSLKDGNSAGAVSMIDAGTSGSWSSLFTPAGLQYYAPSTEIYIHKVNGNIRQIITNEACVDVITLSSTSYELRFFPFSRMATGTTYPRSFSGFPYVTYLIEQGSGGGMTLKITRETRQLDASAVSGDAPGTTTVVGVSDANAPIARTEVTTLTRTGTWPDFTWLRQDWNVVATPQTFLAEEERTPPSGGNPSDSRTETVKTRVPGATTPTTQVIRKFVPKNWGEEVDTLTRGSNSATEVATIYDYYPDPNVLGSYTALRSSTTTGGIWEAFQYDPSNFGVVTRAHRQYQSLPATVPADLTGNTSGEITSYSYDPDAFGRLTRPTLIETRINSTLTAKTTVAYTDNTLVNGLALVQATRDEQADNSGAILRTITKYYREDQDEFFRSQIHSIQYSDGRKQSFAYQHGTWDGTSFTKSASNGLTAGPASRTVVITGSATSGTSYGTYDGYDIDDLYLVSSVDNSDPNNLKPQSKSTLQVTIRDSLAHVVRTEMHVWNANAGPAGWVRVSSVDFAYDLAGHLTSSTASNGAQYSAAYNGDLKTSETDAAGAAFDYVYDSAGRIDRATERAAGPISALTTKFEYDAEHRVTKQTVGWGAPETLVHARAFDDAGRLASESRPGGTLTTANANIPLTTSYTYLPSFRQVTITLPNGGTQIQTYQAEGVLQQVGGSAVVPQYFTYQTESTGKIHSTLRVASSGSSRLRETWVDWLGRTTSVSRPGFYGSGASNEAQAAFVEDYTFDNGGPGAPGTGRLVAMARTGANLATSLFEYDALSQISRAGLKLESTTPSQLVVSSTDRITDSDAYFEKTDNDWWFVHTARTYPAAISIVRERVSGFSGNTRAETKSIDIEGNLTTRVVSVDRANATTTISTTTAGRASAQTQTIIHGATTSVTGFDGLTYTTGYDALHRPSTSTDPRTGTATTTYIYGSTLVSTVKDARGTNSTTLPAVATYTYDGAGRVAAVQDAAGQTTYTSYNTRDQVVRRWGSATYPAEFAYNAYGERVAMRTFGSTSDNFTATTWPRSDSGLDATGTPNPASWTAGDKTTWLYDEPSGLLVSKTDAAGKSVRYTYNGRGQIKTRKWARTLSDGTTPVTTTYDYFGDTTGDLQTGELKTVSYNDGTPKVTYTYTRLGQLDSADQRDSSNTILRATDFIYDPAHPNRLATEALDANFYAGRVITRLYDPASSGTFGGYTTGVVAGGAAGFQLGISSNVARDLHQKFAYSNAGRFAGVTTGVGNPVAQTNADAAANAGDFVYDYVANSALVSGYHTGANFAVSRDYEPMRDLVTRVEAKWGATSLTRFDLVSNNLSQRLSAKQSGLAFQDYTGSASTGVYDYYLYNARGEVKTAMMARGAPPADLTTTPATADQLPGRRFEYRYDNAGNRLTAGATGTAAGGDDEYALKTNGLNQYDTKENNTVRILGSAAVGATITASAGATVHQLDQDRNFAADLVPANTSGPVQGTLTVNAAVQSGSSGYVVKSVSRNYFVPRQTQTFAYDADGNLTGDGVWNYTWDAENRLVRLASALPSGFGFARLQLDFKYDYLGRRIEKQVVDLDSNQLTFDHRYVYDGWNLVAETTAAGVLVRSYTWGLDVVGSLGAAGGVGALLQIVNHYADGSKAVYFPSIDGNGNIAALTRGDGVLAAVYEYSPFGELLRKEVLDAAVGDQPFRFSSKFIDDESGLVYFGARYYSPGLARFLSRDPIGEAGGLNLYGFCGNDAVNGWDYLGLTPPATPADRPPTAVLPAGPQILYGVPDRVQKDLDLPLQPVFPTYKADQLQRSQSPLASPTQQATAAIATGQDLPAPNNAENISTTRILLNVLGTVTAATGRVLLHKVVDTEKSADARSTGEVRDRVAGIRDNAVFVAQWITNDGKEERYYTDGSRLAELMKSSSGVKRALEEYKAAGMPSTPFPGIYATMQGYRDVFIRAGALNPAEFQVGGYIWTISKNADGTLNMHIDNDASWRSLLGQPTFSDYYNRAAGGIFPKWDVWPVHTRDDVPMGGNIHQVFDLTLPAPTK